MRLWERLRKRLPSPNGFRNISLFLGSTMYDCLLLSFLPNIVINCKIAGVLCM
ncbi:hypothetical protein BDZ91DRAFT_724213 [Kalaharituber pfeilii]|nr:hypothetical protein BDZ91DRAFT_724213 [Kalaharituber pfeilii]